MFESWLRLLGFTLIFLAALPAAATAQGRFVLEQVFDATNNRNMPVSWDWQGNGYEAGFSIRYTDRCIGSYRVRFVFDRDIRTLRDGDEFAIRVRKLTGRPPCGHKWTRASILAANNIIGTSAYPRFPASYETNGNIRTVHDGKVNMWDGGPVEATVILKAEAKKNVRFTAFALNVGHSSSFSRMFFLYRYVQIKR